MAINISFSTLTKYIKSALVTVLIGLCIIIGYIIYLAQDLPSLDQLENYDPDLVTRIYSADGEILDELFLEKRIFVSLDQIQNNMKNAVIASEDRRFYNHWGIDSRSIVRAVVINIISLGYVQGFSSLTQQVDRTLYDTIGFKKTITRKIKEIITATTPKVGNDFPISKPITKAAPINPNKTPSHLFNVTFSFKTGPAKAFVSTG